ncbi:uncharacterized protein DUF1572 [Gelidibacter algens]|uniref:Uncharacterized protein DUF1572 n=1 Tax=Gelidibacter algens TaxID=49280 RepID=A0A1A7QJ11_9FLAO|nr:DUF1572 family protein [Gelidibacter algens]OBX19318.1 DinB superfamily protein [Gelidibacter algens]RAJ25129.1 uncharacterized protein DUF1572 [Gelidibacter algens]
MLIESYRKLYSRELKKLKIEIELYKDEDNLWIRDKEIANSAGNLCLHLIGNLSHFIGHVLGKTDYVRNRELEFITDDTSREYMIYRIKELVEIVDNTLKTLNNDELQRDYPISKFESTESIEFLLVHALMHLNYHVGQINYHRRFLDF